MDRDINKYELAKMIAEIIKYQQNEIDTYKIIVIILLLVIGTLLCEAVKWYTLGNT